MNQFKKVVVTACVALTALALPVFAEEQEGKKVVLVENATFSATPATGLAILNHSADDVSRYVTDQLAGVFRSNSEAFDVKTLQDVDAARKQDAQKQTGKTKTKAQYAKNSDAEKLSNAKYDMKILAEVTRYDGMDIDTGNIPVASKGIGGGKLGGKAKANVKVKMQQLDVVLKVKVLKADGTVDFEKEYPASASQTAVKANVSVAGVQTKDLKLAGSEKQDMNNKALSKALDKARRDLGRQYGASNKLSVLTVKKKVATMDATSADGIKKGDLFVVSVDGKNYALLKVIKIDDKSCTAKIVKGRGKVREGDALTSVESAEAKSMTFEEKRD